VKTGRKTMTQKFTNHDDHLIHDTKNPQWI